MEMEGMMFIQYPLQLWLKLLWILQVCFLVSMVKEVQVINI